MNSHLPDLASRDLGGSVIAANDELFAARENLIRVEAPQFAPHTFGPKGQIMDGWETRRRRDVGSDHAVVRLGLPGIVRSVVIDTAFFRGNFPPEASIEACGAEGHPAPPDLDAMRWTTLVERTALKGDAAHEFAVADEHRWTHVRLTIYPDGGVARLRVHGEPVPDPRLLTTTVDLAALENGGTILDCSNDFYSTPTNLIKPGLTRVMGDGWETARRRDDGNDWVRVRLACPGRIVLAEIDTTHFVGNAPGWATLTGGGGEELLPRTPLQPDTRHRFALTGPEVAEVRLDVFPDGGLGRLRLYGEPTLAGLRAIGLRFLNSLPADQAEIVLRACCAAPAWIEAVRSGRPYADVDALYARSDEATMSLDDEGFAAALAVHPRIGERSRNTWSRQEQAGVDDTVRSQLATANAEYEQRFGHVYLVCATGKSGEELLALCRERLRNDAATEHQVALGELAKIARIRIDKLMGLTA
jgi:allantoicase